MVSDPSQLLQNPLATRGIVSRYGKTRYLWKQSMLSGQLVCVVGKIVGKSHDKEILVLTGDIIHCPFPPPLSAGLWGQGEKDFTLLCKRSMRR